MVGKGRKGTGSGKYSKQSSNNQGGCNKKKFTKYLIGSHQG